MTDLSDQELELIQASLIAERDRIGAIINEMVMEEIPRPSWYWERKTELQALIERVFAEQLRRQRLEDTGSALT